MTMPPELDGVPVEEVVGRGSSYPRFTREEKEVFVEEYSALPEFGGHRGTYLRLKNLRRNQISAWRKELASKPSGGRRRSKRTPEHVELDRLRKSEVKRRNQIVQWPGDPLLLIACLLHVPLVGCYCALSSGESIMSVLPRSVL